MRIGTGRGAQLTDTGPGPQGIPQPRWSHAPYHSYLSTHASTPPRTNSRRGDWHTEDIYLEKDRFIDLMEVAIKTKYKKGLRNYDVN